MKRIGVYLGNKAYVPIRWSERLYITLIRGRAGTRRIQRHTCDCLGLKWINRTVVYWNTAHIRGMVNRVKNLVAVETAEMYEARKAKDAESLRLRPPIIINHKPSIPAEKNQEVSA